MRQRKSRPHNFTFVVATALAAIAVIAPAAASGDSGGDEYTLNVPGGGNTPLNGQSGGGGGSSSTSSDVSPATGVETDETTAAGSGSGSESATGAGSSSGGKGSNVQTNNGDKNSSSKANGSGEKPRDGLVSPDNSSAPAVGADSSDDGGVPVFLIVIAILAAGCVGFAIWRMRRGGGDGTGGEKSHSTTEPGTQSL